MEFLQLISSELFLFSCLYLDMNKEILDTLMDNNLEHIGAKKVRKVELCTKA